MTVVTPDEEHRLPIAEVLATSLNFPLASAIERASLLPLADMRVAIDGGAIVACAGEFRFDEWFAGHPLGCSGIWGVATLPEHRTGGLASACVRALLDGARDRGAPVSALFPAVLPPYRKLGFELAGVFVRHRLPLAALPTGADALPPVEPLDVAHDIPGIRAAFREWLAGSTGVFEPTEDSYWRDRVFPPPTDDTQRTVVVREDGRVTGVASFKRVEATGALSGSFGIDCRTLFSVTPGAQGALWKYFRDHRGLGQWLQWAGPPADPVAMASVEAFVERPFRYDWMLRLLDVPGALEARGYPTIDTAAVIAIDDPSYGANSGTWRIAVDGGAASVERIGDRDRPPIPIGILSSMFSGYLKPRDAARLGHLEADDPAVEALTAMFAGPDPWSPFFF